MAESAMHGHPGMVCYEPECGRAPVVVGTNRRCRCRGDYRRFENGACYVCKGFVLADWEWDLLTSDNSRCMGTGMNAFGEPCVSSAPCARCIDAKSGGCKGDGQEDYGNTCTGYATSQHPCNKCSAAESGGFVETTEEINTLLNMETDNFPCTLLCHRGDKTISVTNVRMDSVAMRESAIPGYVDVTYERYGSSVTGTVPMVDYFETE